MERSYLHGKFLHRINSARIKIIVECGSRDGLDALALYEHYHPEKLFTFECNPEAIALCKENLKGTPNIKLIEKAVFNENRIVDFYPTDMDRSSNKELGASSMLWHRDNKVAFFQKKTQVEAVRLDTFMAEHKIDHIDLLCIDVQGVEKEVLEGLGSRIRNVKYIITEVVFEHYYSGDILFAELKDYLEKHGFDLLTGSGLLGNRTKGLTNCLFRNRKRV